MSEERFNPFKQKPAFHYLKDLGADFMQAIDEKLTAGEAAMSVVKWIQEDQGLLKDKTPAGLCKTLERYRKKELRQKVLNRMTEITKHESLTTIVKRLNAMDELEDLCTKQKKRVGVMLTMEDGKPVLLKGATEQIALYRDMLVDLGRMQMETGVIVRAPKTIKGIFAGQKGPAVAFSWTEAQDRVLQELEHVIGSSEAE